MKILKFSAEQTEMVLAGLVATTLRVNDDKDITLDDDIECVNSSTQLAFGRAVVSEVAVKRLGQVTPEEVEGILRYASINELYDKMRQYYGRQVGPETVVKVIRFDFTPYAEQRSAGPAQPPVIKEIKMHADGGSRGNPGPSAAGFVLMEPDGTVILEKGIYLGITTNNQAEYQAVRYGLEEARRLQAQRVDVYLDSLLVVNQMKGVFKVKNRELWPIHEAIKELVGQFKEVRFTHVPREYNKLADAEVNRILDEMTRK